MLTRRKVNGRSFLSNINWLADWHHSDLSWALHLYAKRLGAKLWRPYLMPWYDKGYYRLYGHLGMPDPYRFIAEQYLEKFIYNYDPQTQTGIGTEARKGCQDYPLFNLLTLEQAKETPLDIIICSVRENEPYFRRFRNEFHPKAKLVRVSGNQLEESDESLYPNFMGSANCSFEMSKAPHKVLFHQEFDMNLCKPQLPRYTHNVYSFMNNLVADQGEESVAVGLWHEMEHNLPEFNFRSYGGRCEYGRIYPKRALISKMLQSSFMFQIKYLDGYGHILANSMALGRPVITKRECYKGKLLEKLLVDGKSCIYIDEGYERIREFANIDKLREMSKFTSDRFRELVNFDREWDEILLPFFNNLI